MAQIKVLFADDHIPDDNITDEKIKEVYTKRYPPPEWREGFCDYFVAAREAVKILRDAGYEVTIANSIRSALHLIRETHFNLAIIDLTWSADKELEKIARSSAGWKICEALDQRDKELARHTPQIIRSHRFSDDSALSIQAADKGKLPIFKGYDIASHQALRAAVKFIEDFSLIPSKDQMIQQLWEETRKQSRDILSLKIKNYEWWFKLTIGFVGIGVLVLLTGVILALMGMTQIGTVTSLVSLVPTICSSLLFVQLRRAEKAQRQSEVEITKLQTQILKLINQKMKSVND